MVCLLIFFRALRANFCHSNKFYYSCKDDNFPHKFNTDKFFDGWMILIFEVQWKGEQKVRKSMSPNILLKAIKKRENGFDYF